MAGPPAGDPQLNDDVLSVVFKLISEKTRASFHDTLSISHVCRRWRNLAVEHCPELWRRYAFLTKKDGTIEPGYPEQMLSRCGDLSLDVGWEWENIPYAGTDATASSAILAHTPHAFRLRSLHLVLPKERAPLLTSQEALNTWVIPHLEELAVRQRVTGDRIRSFYDGVYVQVPTLRKLSIFRCWIQIDKMTIPNLQSFTGFFSSAGPMEHGDGFPPTFHGWLKHLANWPLLSILRLQLLSPTPDLIGWPLQQGVLTRDLERDSLVTPTQVSLQHLTELHLAIYYHDLEILLDNVDMAQIRRAVIHIYASRSGRLHGLGTRVHQLVSKHALPSRSRGNRMAISVNLNGTVCGVAFSRKKEYQIPPVGASYPFLGSDDISISLHSLQIDGVYEPLRRYLNPLLNGWVLAVRWITHLRVEVPSGALPEGTQKAFHTLLVEAKELKVLFCRRDLMSSLTQRRSRVTDLGNGRFLCRVVLPAETPSASTAANGAGTSKKSYRHGHEFRIVTHEVPRLPPPLHSSTTESNWI